MWWRIWIRIDGEYVVVVYGSNNDDDAVASSCQVVGLSV